MAIKRGPSIVRDGLVLCLDAKDPNFYSGSGSTATELVSERVVTLNSIPIQNYTPSSAGTTAKAMVFSSGGTNQPTIPDSTDFDFRGSISWDFVACRETSSSGRQTVWSQINSSNPWNGLGIVTMGIDSTKTLHWWGGNYNGSSFAWWNSGVSVPENKWCYCAGTWSGTTRKVYVRTIGDTSFSTATTTTMGSHNGATSNQTFMIGNESPYSGNAYGIIDGAISFLKIYNRALSDTEILQNYETHKNRFGL